MTTSTSPASSLPDSRKPGAPAPDAASPHAGWAARFGLGPLFSVDFVPPAGGLRGHDVAGQVRAAQIQSIARFAPVVMLANMLNAAVLVVSLVGTSFAPAAFAWGGVLLAYSLLMYRRARAQRGRAVSRYASRRAIWRAVAHAGVVGGLWALAPLLFFHQSPVEELVVACLSIGMMCAGCFVLSALPLAVLAYLTPMALGCAVALGRGGTLGHVLIIVLVLSYAMVLCAAAVAQASQLIGRVVAQIEAEHRANIDPLTGLPNRAAFIEAMATAVLRCERYGEGFALLSMDLDGFKAVNDRLGHPVGDQLLVQTAGRLSAAIRDRDTLARVGGDEFVLLLQGVTASIQVAEIAERLLTLCAAPMVLGGEVVRTRLSIGVALAPSDGLDPEVLIERADTALYEVKRDGKNAVRLFRANDDQRVRRRKAWSLDLRKAIARGEFHLDFQPIVRTSDRRVTGFEALLRWTHATEGAISPAEFVAFAEKSGQIHEIGEWVIDEACRIAATWPDDLRVAVNFSLDQFRSGAIVGRIRAALARHGLAPNRFEIEVTESVLLENEPVVVQTIRAAHAAGLRLALDDFGTGFSSLRHLQELPIDAVKVDRSFVAGLRTNERGAAIVRAIVGLCRELDIGVIAEGVENEDQYEDLREMGCREAQGYWIGRPQGADAVASLLPRTRKAPRLVA